MNSKDKEPKHKVLEWNYYDLHIVVPAVFEKNSNIICNHV